MLKIIGHYSIFFCAEHETFQNVVPELNIKLIHRVFSNVNKTDNVLFSSPQLTLA